MRDGRTMENWRRALKVGDAVCLEFKGWHGQVSSRHAATVEQIGSSNAFALKAGGWWFNRRGGARREGYAPLPLLVPPYTDAELAQEAADKAHQASIAEAVKRIRSVANALHSADCQWSLLDLQELERRLEPVSEWLAGPRGVLP